MKIIAENTAFGRPRREVDQIYRLLRRRIPAVACLTAVVGAELASQVPHPK